MSLVWILVSMLLNLAIFTCFNRIEIVEKGNVIESQWTIHFVTYAVQVHSITVPGKSGSVKTICRFLGQQKKNIRKTAKNMISKYIEIKGKVWTFFVFSLPNLLLQFLFEIVGPVVGTSCNENIDCLTVTSGYYCDPTKMCNCLPSFINIGGYCWRSNF